jgi:zinc transport system permease protein
MDATISFGASYDIWRDAMLAALIGGAALGYLGVWIVLRRIVFVPLAISQAASLGVVGSFFLLDWISARSGTAHGTLERLVDPVWFSLIAALLTALAFARRSEHGAEITAVIYSLAASLVLILGGFIRGDVHDVQSVLFGNAVLVETTQVVTIAVAAVIMAALHALYYRRFLFVGFDPDSASAAGFSVFGHQALLYGTIALVISATTRVLGALPVFGLLVLPGLTGLNLGRTMGRAFVFSIASATAAAGLGYYASFVLELPTGACMVAVAGGIWGASALARLIW